MALYGAGRSLPTSDCLVYLLLRFTTPSIIHCQRACTYDHFCASLRAYNMIIYYVMHYATTGLSLSSRACALIYVSNVWCVNYSEVDRMLRLLVNQRFGAGMWGRFQQYRQILPGRLQGWSSRPQRGLPRYRLHQDESLQRFVTDNACFGFIVSLSQCNSLASSWCDHSMLASLFWHCLTVPSLLQLC